MKHVRLVGLALGGVALAWGFSFFMWTLDYTTTAGFAVGNIFVIGVLAYWIGYMFWALTISDRKDFAYNSLACVSLWLFVPPICALALWDRDTSAREVLAASWFWLLKPLPIDVGGALGLAAPNLSTLGTLDAITFVLLQVSTVALILFNVGILVGHYRDRSLARLKSEVLSEVRKPPEL